MDSQSQVSTDLTLQEFLTQRNISLSTIQELEKEKIDVAIILLMSDDELQKYFPAKGDVYAVKDFAKRKSGLKKLGLLEKLKLVMKRKDKSSDNVEDEKPSKKGRKETRVIKLGWLHRANANQKFHQIKMLVNKKSGGGTKLVSVSKTANYLELIELGVKNFFPDGLSSKGPKDDFDMSICDFEGNILTDANTTIEEMFQTLTKASKSTRLYLYLGTTSKDPDTSRLLGAESLTKSVSYTLSTSSNEDDCVPSTSKLLPPSSVIETRSAASSYLQEFDPGYHWDNFNPPLSEENEDNLFGYEFLTANNASSSITSPTFTSVIPSTSAIIEPAAAVTTSATALANTGAMTTLSTVDESWDDLNVRISSLQVLKLHRGRVFDELIKQFEIYNFTSNDAITIQMVLPNGDMEKGDDQGGVLRDALSEFWETFYEKCTLGTTFKIPFLRHDFTETKWKCVGQILIFGFLREGFFPIRIVPAFMEYSLGDSVSHTNLIEDFKKCVSDIEVHVIDSCLSKQFDINDEDTMDFFDTYESKRLPTAENVEQLLNEIAHKEIIQKPAFVADCFAQELKKSPKMVDIKIRHLYEKLKPTAKNCLSKITMYETDFKKITEKMKEVFNYLKRFIKEADEKLRSSFLRFCTGADLPIKTIKVAFKGKDEDEDSFSRTPTAHTCSGLLEVPLCYENFLDFRNEFNNILSNKVWVMDVA